MSILIYLILGVCVLLVLANLRTRSLARDAERRVPQVGQIHAVPGGALHYVDTGPCDTGPREAPVLVMIHGLAGQLQHYTYALSGLLSSEFRVILVDRPGCGYSTLTPAQADGASLADQGRMIGALLDDLDIGPAVLVGHSLGGAVALAMALDRPDKTAALALLCPLAQVQSQAPEAFKGLQIRSIWLRNLLAKTISVPIAKLTADKVLTLAFTPETCPADFMDKAGAVLGLRPGAFISASADMAASEARMPAQVARYESELKVPGGVLFGADDGILSPEQHGPGLQAQGLSYETLPGRGHMIPITAPQECADFIRRMAAKAG